MPAFLFRLAAPTLLALSCAEPAMAATLVVNVSGIQDDAGFVGCALFAADAAAAFPLDPSRATTRRAPARAGSLQCEFKDLPAGTYAVSAAHDRNGNGRTDRNLVGLPTEPWAVSRNIRPALRAPRFDESSLTLGIDESRQIELSLAR